jgi:long-chain acyl-CoA synthetase
MAANIIADADVVKNSGVYQKTAINPLEDIAVLQYTGGTTGTPKGAMLTHANVSVNCQQGGAWAPNLVPGQERALAALPFFHVFAMTAVMNFALAQGAELIIMPRFVLDDAMALITKAKPTVMPGVPTMFIAMLNHPKLQSFDLSSLKFCLSGGAPLPVEVKEKFERLTGCKVVEGYGLSEASPSVTCNPVDGPVKEGSIGQPLPGTIVSLRDLADPTKEVVLGEKGEICIKGPQVMKGYWKRPEETANQFVGEYLRTGDVGIMDDEGFIFIVDRIKDLIICSGYNVYPRRIEEAIYEHPAVEEVTVIGIKDEYRGEAPKAFVKLKAGAQATKADIFKHLEPKISKIEMPAEIEFRDALPKTMIGKLSKKELKAEEAARQKAKGK